MENEEKQKNIKVEEVEKPDLYKELGLDNLNNLIKSSYEYSS